MSLLIIVKIISNTGKYDLLMTAMIVVFTTLTFSFMAPTQEPKDPHSLTAKPALRRSIVVPISLSEYQELVGDFPKFRDMLERAYAQSPELFPPEFEDGFQSKDKRFSRKLRITLRRITVSFGG